jgi:hypothetical protein
MAARITFYRLIARARLPQRAERSALGSLPARAFQYCQPVRVASGFGYYVFPPIGFSLRWDGNQVAWDYAGGPGWAPLTVAQFPDFAVKFDAAAREAARGFSPPFLSALPEPGVVQIWTGLVVRTAPLWDVLIRPPANLPASQQYDLYEGVVETDRWFGPLFTNIRIKKTGETIRFDPDWPFAQVQPLPREVTSEASLSDYALVTELAGLDWAAYAQTVVAPNTDPARKRGAYAAAARRRGKGGGGDV